MPTRTDLELVAAARAECRTGCAAGTYSAFTAETLLDSKPLRAMRAPLSWPHSHIAGEGRCRRPYRPGGFQDSERSAAIGERPSPQTSGRRQVPAPVAVRDWAVDMAVGSAIERLPLAPKGLLPGCCTQVLDSRHEVTHAQPHLYAVPSSARTARKALDPTDIRKKKPPLMSNATRFIRPSLCGSSEAMAPAAPQQRAHGTPRQRDGAGGAQPSWTPMSTAADQGELLGGQLTGRSSRTLLTLPGKLRSRLGRYSIDQCGRPARTLWVVPVAGRS